MIQVTLTFNTIAAAVAALAKIPEADAAMGTVTAVSAGERVAVRGTSSARAAADEAPGKSKNAPLGSAAPTAPSSPTAEAAQSPAPAAPAQSTEQPAPPASTAAPADAPSAPEAFDYGVLQKAVNAAVPKHGKDKLLAIAKAHGAENFKGLPASAWAAAHADVVALG